MKNSFFNTNGQIENLSDSELLEIAKKQNKSLEEIKADLHFAIVDLEYSVKEIETIIQKNNYTLFPDHRVHIGEYGMNHEIDYKFLCHDRGEFISSFSISNMALVTGFGPTNAPTAGTLSVILRLLDIQNTTRIYSHVIISDLGALNSRKKPFSELLRYTDQFIAFICELGFDLSCGEIRTHNNNDHARVTSIASSVLTLDDFLENKEVTEDMYKRLKIQGNDFSTMVDQTFTVADILLPIMRDNKKLVLVSSGLEEHYYPRLTRIVIDRISKSRGGLGELIDGEPVISAIYGKIISGLFPYVKMSKSIPDSAINIGDTEKVISDKILHCGPRNEFVVLQMMEIASNWNTVKINHAKEVFNNLNTDINEWKNLKQEYLDYFLQIKNIWEKNQNNQVFSIKNKLFY